MSAHTFIRTECACAECTKCCRRQPGPLAPGDLKRIADYLGVAVNTAKAQFCASPGALVKDSMGNTARVGSITPKRVRGKCVFLTDEGKCSIHPVAPFGCAYFDTHMARSVAMPRSLWLVQSIMADHGYRAMRETLDYATSYKPVSY